MPFTRSPAAKLMLCVAIGCAAAGLVLWPIPYEQLATSSLVRPWVIAGVLAGCAIRYFTRRWAFATVVTGVIVALGFVLATLGRAVFDGLRDPTSHNLLPFELVLAALVGLVSGFAGALATWLVQATTSIVVCRTRQ